MIELNRDSLDFTFPEVHPEARLTVGFQRTLRIPDDGKTHYLPPGLGNFPLRHVDDFASKIPDSWSRHGGVMLPMHQAEAMWAVFSGRRLPSRGTTYPFAIKIAAGKINAVTGKSWAEGLARDPQTYMVSTRQPWLDGYAVKNGVVAQFVAMPLGEGYSAEEQITGVAEHGGLQIEVFPMKREVFERRFPERVLEQRLELEAGEILGKGLLERCRPSADMGLAPGGRMKQEIFDDPFDLDDWDLQHGSRCFVHIANSQVWQAITGLQPPSEPPTARDYSKAGLPWFDFYSEAPAVEGSAILDKLKSVFHMGQAKGESPLPENEGAPPKIVRVLAKDDPGSGRKSRNEVREGNF
jgi:hypothetical protein